MEDLGKHFWLKLSAVCALGGVAAFVVLLITWKAVVAWGLLGLLLLIAVLALAAAWYNDRKHPRVD
jgi:hypothetical protein